MAELRLRTDHYWGAGRKRAVLLGAVEDPRTVDPGTYDPKWIDQLNDPSFEEAKEGDVWVVRGNEKYRAYRGHNDWPIVGYGLWCPQSTCHYGAHAWVHASDCPARDDLSRSCKTGEKIGGAPQSCWLWTGSVEGGDLTAQPSLFCNFPECGWHGFLVQGEMRSV